MNRRSIRPGHSVRTAVATAIAALSALSWDAVAQFEVTVDTGSTSQNFNTLITSGTNQPWSNDTTLGLGPETLDGWSLFTYTNVAISAYDAGAGGSNAGKFYSFGTGTTTERAFGGVGSAGGNQNYFGLPQPAGGAVAGYITFAATNNSASTLGKFTLGFDGEQWRNGGATSPAVSVAQTMKFEYGFGATFDTVGAWTAPGGSFDWTSPVFGTSTGAAVDGNVAGLVASRGGTINGLTWATGETLWLRWIELNDAGNDHGLAIDNFSLAWETAPPAKDLVWTPISADWNTTDTNWKDTSNNNIVAFTNNDTVTFDSTGLAQPNVQVAAGGVSPNAVTVNVGALETYRISGGAINTNAPLQKQGVGTLELGSVYLGGLNAAAGTVRTLASEVFGNNSPVTLGNNSTFDLNHHDETIGALDLTGASITTGAGVLTVTGNIIVQESPTSTPSTIDGAISVGTGIRNLTVADSMAAEDLIINAGIIGSARIALVGPGTIALNGDNSAYSGNFQLNGIPAAPTVIVNSTDAPFGTSTVFFNGGVLHAAVPLTGADKLNNDFSLGGGIMVIEGEDVEIAGTVSFFQGASKVLQINGDTVVTLTGIIQDSATNNALAIAGTGTAIMAGDGSDAIGDGYTGAFQVGDSSTPGGHVVLASPHGLGSGPVTLYAYDPAEVELDVAVSATIGGLNSVGDGTQKVVLGQGAPGIDPTVLTINSLDFAIYEGSIETAPGHAGEIVKDGAGEQVLSGTQDYDKLTVLAGIVTLESSLADAVIDVQGGRVNLTEDQTLAALNIGAGGLVVLGDPALPSPAASPQAVPEPGAFTLLFTGAIGLLNRRRR